MPQLLNFATTEMTGLEILKRKLNIQFEQYITRNLVLRAGFTPAGTGPDTFEYTVPYGQNGVSAITYSVTRITLRVGTAGGAPSVDVEKSVDPGVFNPITVGNVTLAPGAFEGSTTTGLGTVDSGDKLRCNFLVLGTATDWTVTVELATV